MRDEQSKRWMAERNYLLAEGQRDHAQRELKEVQLQSQSLLRDVMEWMGRVGFGFGVGDPIPKQERVQSDTVKGRMDPATALKEMLQHVARAQERKA